MSDKPTDDTIITAKLLHLDPQQRQILTELLGTKMQDILSFQFNTPDADQLRIRQHAAMHGSMEMLKDLLSYDAVLLAEFEEERREAEQVANATSIDHTAF
jgi:hypothetical protein